MDLVAKAAFITAQAACLQADVAAMQCQNDLDKEAGRPNSYQPHDFEALPDKYGLGHNDVLIYLQQ